LICTTPSLVAVLKQTNAFGDVSDSMSSPCKPRVKVGLHIKLPTEMAPHHYTNSGRRVHRMSIRKSRVRERGQPYSGTYKEAVRSISTRWTWLRAVSPPTLNRKHLQRRMLAGFLVSPFERIGQHWHVPAIFSRGREHDSGTIRLLLLVIRSKLCLM
jgi:hypothetical protein